MVTTRAFYSQRSGVGKLRMRVIVSSIALGIPRRGNNKQKLGRQRGAVKRLLTKRHDNCPFAARKSVVRKARRRRGYGPLKHILDFIFLEAEL